LKDSEAISCLIRAKEAMKDKNTCLPEQTNNQSEEKPINFSFTKKKDLTDVNTEPQVDDEIAAKREEI